MSIYTVDSVLVERPTVWGNANGYNVAEVLMPNIPTDVSGGAGQDVTVSVVFSEGNLPTNLNYTIQAVANQACAISYDNKAITGFDIILSPLASGVTLAAGTVDVIVSWTQG